MGVPINRTKIGVQSASPDAVIMRTIIATILAIFTAFLLSKIPELPKPTLHSVVGEVSVTKPVLAESVTDKQASIQSEQPPKPVVEAPKPTPPPEVWDVTASPHGKVSVEQINQFLAILKAKGVTKQGAAYLTGNFIAESHLQPCDVVKGDGGLAWGLGQWHPGRRSDMPCELVAQVNWAIDVEMPRDAAAGRYTSVKDVIMNPASTRADLLQAFKNWERYGLEGNRAAYGDAIMSQL